MAGLVESSYGSSGSTVLHPRIFTLMAMRTKRKVVHEPEMPPEYAHSYFSDHGLQTGPDLDLDTDIDIAPHPHADAAPTATTTHFLRRSHSLLRSATT
jgi:hypothetical protein